MEMPEDYWEENKGMAGPNLPAARAGTPGMRAGRLRPSRRAQLSTTEWLSPHHPEQRANLPSPP